jgi:hypothetical protein
VFGSINKHDLRNQQIVYLEKYITNFDKLVNPIDDQLKFYSDQNRILISLKDLLLSKLATIEN